jgi:hypothetical protein
MLPADKEDQVRRQEFVFMFSATKKCEEKHFFKEPKLVAVAGAIIKFRLQIITAAQGSRFGSGPGQTEKSHILFLFTMRVVHSIPCGIGPFGPGSL